MGRPQIKGLSYFPHDTHFHEDIKVRKLVKRYGGGTAAYIYLTLLEKIYSQGYYLEFQEDDFFIISEMVYEEEDFIRNVLKGCLELGLFDKDMYERHGVITSKAIQQRYMEIKKLLQRKVQIVEYNLLAPPPEVEEPATKGEAVPSASAMVVSVGEPSVHKEEKVPPSQPSSPESSRDRPQTVPGQTGSLPTSGFDFEAGINEIRSDQELMSDLSTVFGMPYEETCGMLDKFVSFCRVNEKTGHTSLKDLKNHLQRWVSIDRRNSFIYRKSKSTRIKQTYDGYDFTSSGSAPDRRRAFTVTHELPEQAFTGSF